jgi:tRNA pseudouridine32 synthase / 23S rRNA pseudouridine746 synthase
MLLGEETGCYSIFFPGSRFLCSDGRIRGSIFAGQILVVQFVDDYSVGVRYFSEDTVSQFTPPERFTFPFHYEPHALARIAATELQEYLSQQTDFDYDFGLSNNAGVESVGKMFGVLVVSDADGRLGYLTAFSGKLGDSNYHPGFVPPVFDRLAEDGFFRPEEAVIDEINAQIEALTQSDEYNEAKSHLAEVTERSQQVVAAIRLQHKLNKENRRLQREALMAEGGTDEALLAQLFRESNYDQHVMKVLKAEWRKVIDEAQGKLQALENKLDALKQERRDRSAALQDRLFEQYSFLNQAGERQTLRDIFSKTVFGKPPAGAGECATPKLLQYAFANGYVPLAMAEFWWGASPSSEIRQHGHFYPACTGKCKPILAHMLEGMDLDENPFLRPAKEGIEIELICEDEWLAIVNKPAGLRSVPGVDIVDSVYSRLKTMWGGEEPFIVHRLDMGTSGLLVVAKTQEVHKHLQRQFLERTVKKRYTALLSGRIEGKGGEIRLPLRPDPFNRPAQLVCFETGKKSVTLWKAVEQMADSTRVHFWPLTGRTHQLRMHAAHELGLNAPIVGDDLYGTAAERLCLHAASLSFIHPVTGEELSFEVKEDF